MQFERYHFLTSPIDSKSHFTPGMCRKNGFHILDIKKWQKGPKKSSPHQALQMSPKLQMPVTFAIQALAISKLDQSIENHSLHRVCVDKMNVTL